MRQTPLHVPLGLAQPPATGGLDSRSRTIKRAEYGTGDKWADVTAKVAAAVKAASGLPAGGVFSIQVRPQSVYNSTILVRFVTIAAVKWAGFFPSANRRTPLAVLFFLVLFRPFVGRGIRL